MFVSLHSSVIPSVPAGIFFKTVSNNFLYYPSELSHKKVTQTAKYIRRVSVYQLPGHVKSITKTNRSTKTKDVGID